MAAAAKAGAVELVRTAAVELARYNTTVNGIRSGFIQTIMTASIPSKRRSADRQPPRSGRSA